MRFRLTIARYLVDQQGAGDDLSVPAAELANHRTMFGDDELKWPVRHGFRIGTTLCAVSPPAWRSKYGTPRRG